MNVNDLSKFSLGQYGSVSLDSAEKLSLLGSKKYLIGALHIVSNRESSATDNSFKWLIADHKEPLYWGTHYGGNLVLQFDGANINTANDTIKINNCLDWKYIRVGMSFNYWRRGQSDTGLMNSTVIGGSTDPATAGTYYVVAKNDLDKTIQVSASLGGSPLNISTEADVAGPKRALTFPALAAGSNTLIEDALDADKAVTNAVQFYSGDNIVEGVIMYGRWNFVELGNYVRAIAYLIPKMI